MSEATVTTAGRLVRVWPVDRPVWATLLLVHGIGEYSGRYEHVGAQMAEAGIAVRSFDLPGFGESAGVRAYVSSFDDYLQAVAEELVLSREPDTPTALLGHSLGALISYRYAFSDYEQPDALVLSAPGFDAELPALKRAAAPWIAKVAPKLAMGYGITGEQLSRDPAVGEAYFSDPLVYPKSTAALAVESFKAMEASKGQPAPGIPTLVIHGGADTYVPARFSAPLGDQPGVTRKLYHNLRHEMFNEPEGPEVVGDVIDWLRATLTG